MKFKKKLGLPIHFLFPTAKLKKKLVNVDVFEIHLTRMAHANFIEIKLMNERILDSVKFGFLDNLLSIYSQGLF